RMKQRESFAAINRAAVRLQRPPIALAEPLEARRLLHGHEPGGPGGPGGPGDSDEICWPSYTDANGVYVEGGCCSDADGDGLCDDGSGPGGGGDPNDPGDPP